MTLKQLLIASGMLAACLAGSAYGATTSTEPAVAHALALIKSQPAATATAAEDTFTVRDVIVDADGSHHVRFDRTYKGLPVIGGDLVVHSDARGAFNGASHTLHGAINVDIGRQAYDEDMAVQYAETQFGGTADGSPKSSLVVYARNAVPVLAHEVVITGFNREGTPSEMHLVIDANTLQLLDKYDTVETTAAVGTAKTLSAGTVSINTDKGASSYSLTDDTRSGNYATNMSNKQRGNGKLFTDADNAWGNGTTSDAATAGAEAFWGVAQTWDYYKNVQARNGIDNKGTKTYSRVHYGRNYVNAFWSDSCFCMTYGDGDNKTYQSLVALDVTGHELSHGVTSRTANLTYSGESGGLNEGTSDIMGTNVEFTTNNATEPPNYLIGERIFIANKGVAQPTTALRYMFKPSLDGGSADCWSSGVGKLDVHYSSGVANHFYYLLSEGTVVPSNFASKVTVAQLTCNSSTLKGIGRDVAQKIWYRALTTYMTSNTNYAAAKTATLSAAKDLYGSGSTQYNAVTAAWAAVSVN